MPLYSESAVRRFVIPVVASVLLGGFFFTSSASADPKVTRADVEAAFERAEAANEEVNQLVEDQKDLQMRIKAVRKEIAKIDKTHKIQREALGSAIVEQHLEQPLGPTIGLLGSGDPDAFIAGLSALDALNKTRAEALASFEESRVALAQRTKLLKSYNKDLEKAKGDAEKKRQVVQANYNKAKADLALLDAPTRRAITKVNTKKVDPKKVKAPSGAAQAAVAYALGKIGSPYAWGGTGPNSFDCSGLVQAAYASAGVSLPRVVGPQIAASRSISRAELQPGDLVAYPSMSHIGIYIGNGQVVHAPSTGRTVEITSINAGFGVFARPVG